MQESKGYPAKKPFRIVNYFPGNEKNTSHRMGKGKASTQTCQKGKRKFPGGYHIGTKDVLPSSHSYQFLSLLSFLKKNNSRISLTCVPNVLQVFHTKVGRLGDIYPTVQNVSKLLTRKRFQMQKNSPNV